MTEAHPLRKEPHVKYESLKFWITEKQLDQLYDMAFDRSDWGESPHDNKPLNKLCDEITSQKLNGSAYERSEKVLKELEQTILKHQIFPRNYNIPYVLCDDIRMCFIKYRQAKEKNL